MTRTILVVPCYNEAERLDLGRFLGFVRRRDWVQLLLVDDGSTDQTSALLRVLKNAAPRHFLLQRLVDNCGKAEAVRRGLRWALAQQPAFVGFWDADLATPLEAVDEFRRLLEENPQLQVVMGARVRLLGRRIERHAWRHCLGRLFATATSAVLNLPVYDTQCGAKLFRVSAQLDQILHRPFRTDWIFDVELLARWIQLRQASNQPGIEHVVYEMPLNRWSDVAGSKVRPRDFFKAIVELARIYFTYMRPHHAAGRQTELPPPVPHRHPAPPPLELHPPRPAVGAQQPRKVA